MTDPEETIETVVDFTGCVWDWTDIGVQVRLDPDDTPGCF